MTTKSEEARKEFLQGRDLSERLLAQDSRRTSRKRSRWIGVCLGRAGAGEQSPTAKEFFDHLKKAALATSVERRAAPDSGGGGRFERRRGEAAGISRGARGGLSQRRARPFHRRRLLLRPAGLRKGDRALQESHRNRPDLFSRLQHPGLCLPPGRQLCGRGEGLPEYIELIPNDPNPYDSYAELLLKMGKFDEAIASIGRPSRSNPRSSTRTRGSGPRCSTPASPGMRRRRSRRSPKGAQRRRAPDRAVRADRDRRR